MSQNQHQNDVEFIGMIQTQKVSEIHAARGPAIDRDYVRAFAQAHENAGFDRVLVPHHSTSPDATLTVAYAASVTERIHFMLAHRPGFVAPTLAARQFASLDQFSGGRLAVHYISGGSDEEQRRDGDWLDHDQRYARTDEYLDVLRKVWTADKPFDHEGAHYRFKDAFSEVKPVQTLNGRPHVPVYFGGASEAAIPVAGKHADVYAL
ncbi:MAG: LLM class flavin-dependent oxidoreductase, partial [Comamonadaceae bacterium]